LPGSVSRDARLAMFPTKGLDLRADAEILWDDHQIPFVFASDDGDVPYLLGLVHAHLRLGQMEFLKRVSQGRLSEMAGPFTRGIDQSIRVLDLDRAVLEIERSLPEATRSWMERYVQGVNDYRRLAPRRPFELGVLGVDSDEAWTVRDILVFGRLISVDINWLRWFGLLRVRGEPAYPELMARLEKFAERAAPSFGSPDAIPVESLFGMSRSGSNSIAVAAKRSATGGALLANDPHLGLQQPNFWILGGYRSPSHAVVGMMYPGVPFVLMGRNEWIAWGGTNMQGLSSSLYDVSSFEADRFTTRREKIRVRLWPDRTAEVRDCDLGPVLNDAPLLADLDLPPTALRWRGHEPSDEATTMFRVNRARNWDEFRAAFATYAVSGQNLVYADREGNIGQLLALEFFPAAGRTARKLPADPNDPENLWGRSLKSGDLPAAFNPETGYLVSCNNTPVRLDPSVVFLGNSNDRVTRIARWLEEGTPVTPERLMELQRDTFSEGSLRAARALSGLLGAGTPSPPLVAALRAWDGRYDADSRGAVAYQLLLDRLLDGPYVERYGKKIARYLRSSSALHDLVAEDAENGALRADRVREAARASQRDFARGRTWGDMHRIRLAHPIGSVPVIGARYRWGDFPAGGSATTVWKSSHSVTNEPHDATFGQNARHVSDLSDPDANWFVILGGQDGWFGSENLLDQAPLWRDGRYVRIPLREASVRAAFPHRMALAAGIREEGDE